MSSFEIISIFLITAGGFVIFSLSIVTLTARNKKRINYINSLIFFLYGGAIFCDTTYREGTEFLTTYLLHVNLPLVFFLAPLTFICLSTVLNEEFELKKRHISLFIPGVIVLLAFLPYYTLDSATKLNLYPLSSSANPHIGTIVSYINKAPSLIILASFLFSMRSTFFLWNKTTLTDFRIIRSVLIYIGGWVFLGGLFTLASITDNVILYRISSLAGNSMLFLYFIFIYRDPEFFNKIQKESRELKNQVSRLKGLNRDTILIKLETLMVQEELYKVNTLTLKDLSRRLKIRPDQLSELLNRSYSTNFNLYINTFRIEEIKKKLVESPERNILHIAFECGFNSKTTFNTAFLKNTGMSPSKFRIKNSSIS